MPIEKQTAHTVHPVAPLALRANARQLARIHIARAVHHRAFPTFTLCRQSYSLRNPSGRPIVDRRIYLYQALHFLIKFLFATQKIIDM